MIGPAPVRRRIAQIDGGMDLHRVEGGSYYLEHLGHWIELGNDPAEARRRCQGIIEAIHQIDGETVEATPCE